MVKRREKTRMREYVASKLVGQGEEVVSIVDGKIDCLCVGNLGIVLLVDREFANDAFNGLYRKAQEISSNVVPIVYKDGTTFFRNAAHGEEAGLKGNRYKNEKGLSLKLYTPEQVNHMITLRPEEKFIARVKGGWVQYYQPQSAGLEEGIETSRFRPVTLDYTHKPHDEVIGNVQTQSQRWSIWKDEDRRHFDGLLKFKNGFLVPRLA